MHVLFANDNIANQYIAEYADTENDQIQQRENELYNDLINETLCAINFRLCRIVRRRRIGAKTVRFIQIHPQLSVKENKNGLCHTFLIKVNVL